MAKKNDDWEYVETIRQNRKSQPLDFKKFMVKSDTAGRKLEDIRTTLSERLGRPATIAEAQRMYKRAQALEGIARGLGCGGPSLDFPATPAPQSSEEDPKLLSEEEINKMVGKMMPGRNNSSQNNSSQIGHFTYTYPPSAKSQPKSSSKSSGSSGSASGKTAKGKKKAVKVDHYSAKPHRPFSRDRDGHNPFYDDMVELEELED